MSKTALKKELQKLTKENLLNIFWISIIKTVQCRNFINST
jgi:hypothetical protein